MNPTKAEVYNASKKVRACRGLPAAVQVACSAVNVVGHAMRACDVCSMRVSGKSACSPRV